MFLELWNELCFDELYLILIKTISNKFHEGETFFLFKNVVVIRTNDSKFQTSKQIKERTRGIIDP